MADSASPFTDHTPKLWRRLDELNDEQRNITERAKKLFPQLTKSMLIDRRTALQLMAASAALAAASGCADNSSKASEQRMGGKSKGPVEDRYTLLNQNGTAFGVVVRTVGGNPVKIEGDPDHPASLGRSNVQAQAALLSHYDPDRIDLPRLGGKETDWKKFREFLASFSEKGIGEGLHILLQPTASPTLERMIREVKQRLPAAKFYQYRPIPLNNIIPPIDYQSNNLVISFGCDFLGAGPGQVRHAADYAEFRRNDRQESKLIVVESVPTLTGAQADDHVIIEPRQLEQFIQALNEGDITNIAPQYRDLANAIINEPRLLLKGNGISANAGKIAKSLGAAELQSAQLFDDSQCADISALHRALEQDEVDHLMILGGNPAYDAPARLNFAQTLSRSRVASTYLGSECNETAGLCSNYISETPELAQWGDLRSFDGSVGLMRPVTSGTGMTAIETLSHLAGMPETGEMLVRRTYDAPDLPVEQLAQKIRSSTNAANNMNPPPNGKVQKPLGIMPDNRFALVFAPSPHIWDGSLANNSWTQELPAPLTGLAWGNAASIAASTAEKLGLKDGDEIEISLDGASIKIPVIQLPGQAENTLGLPLGYGRKMAAIGSVIGHGVYALFNGNFVEQGALVTKTGAHHDLIFADRFMAADDDKAVRWVTSETEQLRRKEEAPSFFDPEYRAEKQWGMVIDLDICIGCNACTIACQAENNIPVVGPEETAAGRAMHWIRVDRYHRGPAENPDTAFQPVPCMHCELAPCEPVCPVGATTHSSEGINEMTYNRCIGTRSCSNNCPYKVRRFNWFDYQAPDRNVGMSTEGQNPRVTVRDRGVMEKCTFCVQRIEAVRLGDDKGGEDGMPVTACQQTCPTQAIIFGDLADAQSPVAKARAEPRNYSLLEDLNLKTRTTYLAKQTREV